MKTMKRLAALLLAMAMVMSMVACGDNGTDGANDAAPAPAADASGAPATDVAASNVKVGLICLHDENSTYDLNFINGAKEACDAMGVDLVIKTNIGETSDCYNAAVELIEDEGCNYIFADSFGHEDYIIQAASEYADVQFTHATGTKAHTEGLDNYHNAFANIYEGRYLAGVAAGLKLNEMIEAGDITADEAKMGYVGAYTYAEVVSGYTSFYLGAKSVCPTVTMEVKFTGSWYDEGKEKEAATSLIADGCVLISQHADSMGAPTACEDAGVPNVSYNGSTAAACPNTFIVSSRINWAPYFKHAIECVANGTAIETDFVGTLADGSVVLTDLGATAPAAGTAEKLAEVQAGIENGTIHVFDTANFTVEGAALDSYMADVDADENYEKDTEVITDGYFAESAFRSAPYFDVQIDGITLKNTEF